MVDVLTFFFVSDGAKGYANLKSASSAIGKYANFADIAVSGGEIDSDYAYATSDTLRSSVPTMNTNGTTTLDSFLDGKIGMIIGYPSLITELEKSAKRSNSNVSNSIFTARLPQFSTRDAVSVARYSYFGISKLSPKQDTALLFLQYLTSQDAERTALDIYPYLISAQTDFIMSQKGKALSTVLGKAKIDAFLPSPGDKVTVFDYGMKSKFSSVLSTDYDNTPTASLSTLTDTISAKVKCELDYNSSNSNSNDC